MSRLVLSLEDLGGSVERVRAIKSRALSGLKPHLSLYKTCPCHCHIILDVSKCHPIRFYFLLSLYLTFLEGGMFSNLAAPGYHSGISSQIKVNDGVACFPKCLLYIFRTLDIEKIVCIKRLEYGLDFV